MSVKVNIGANSADFQRQMKQVTQQLKSVQSGFNSASEKAKAFGSVTDQLKAKQAELANKIKSQNTIIAMNRDYIRQLNKDLATYKNNNTQLASKIADLEKKQQQATEQFGKGSKEVKELDTELSKLKNQYSANEKAIANCDNKITNQNTKLSENQKALYQTQKALKDVEKELNTTGSKFAQMGEKAGNIASKMTPISVGLTGVGVASAKMAMDLETNMAKIDTIADTTQEPLSDLKQGIIDLSNQTGYSSKEIADDVYEAISSGQKTGDAVNFVTNATKLATAGFTTSSTAVDILTSALNAYGMQSSEANKISDTLIQTQNLGKITIDQLGQSIGQVIPTAATFGVSLQQLGAGYAELTAKGVKPAEATTQLNSMLNQLGKSGTVASKALKKVSGESFQDLMKQGKSVGDVIKILNDYAKSSGQNLNDLFSDVEAGKAAMSIANGGDQFNDFLKQMGNSAGSTDEAVKKMEDTTGFKLNKALTQGKNAMIEFGDTMAPVISAGANVLSTLSSALQHLTNTQKTLIVGVGAAFVAVNGGLLAFSKMAKVVTTNINVMKKASKGIKDFAAGIKSGSSKITPFLKGVQNLGKGALTFSKNIGTTTINLAKNTTQIGLNIAKLIAQKTVQLAVTTATKTATLAQRALNLAMEMNPIGIVIIALTALIATFVLLYTKCDWFRNGVNSMFTAIKNTFFSFANAVKTSFSSVVQGFQNLRSEASSIISNLRSNVISIFENIISFFYTLPSRLYSIGSRMFSSMRSGVAGTIYSVKNAIVSGISSALSYLASLPRRAYTYGVDFIQGMVNGIRNMIGSVRNAVSNVANTIRSYLHFSVPDVGPLTDYESWMPDFLSGLSKGIENNKELVKNAVSGLATDIKTGMTGEINLSSQNATITHVIDNYKNNKEKNNRLIQVNLQVGSKTIATTLVDDLGKIIAKKQSAKGVTRGVLSNI